MMVRRIIAVPTKYVLLLLGDQNGRDEGLGTKPLCIRMYLYVSYIVDEKQTRSH